MSNLFPAMYRTVLTILFITMFLGTIAGCVNNNKAKTRELLAQDFHQLSNDDLILYYYKLEDQIEVVERQQTQSSISLGIGSGTYGRHGGSSGGIGISTGGSTKKVTTDLRDRRNQVKLEMKHRGITP